MTSTKKRPLDNNKKGMNIPNLGKYQSKCSLLIVQGNLHRSETASMNLNQYLAKGKADIALIQEPRVVSKKISGMNRLKGTIFSDLNCKRVRTAIYVKNAPNLKAFAMTKFCDQDLTTVRLEYLDRGVPAAVMLTSAYLPYRTASITTF